MNKLCVLIGEGKSEKVFFQSLLVSQLGFITAASSRSPILFKHSTLPLYWIFPIPSLGKTHKGGQKKLKDVSIYYDSGAIIENHKYIFGNEPLEIHYVILTDTDGKDQSALDQLKHEIEEAIVKSKVQYKTKCVMFADFEIETWFIAGLNEAMPMLLEERSEQIEQILKLDPDKISDPKSLLDSLLSPSISGSSIKIAYDFGRHIDLENARIKSASFKRFYEYIEEANLLPTQAEKQ